MKKAAFIIFTVFAAIMIFAANNAYALDLTSPSPQDGEVPPEIFDAYVVNVFDTGITPLEFDFMFQDGTPTMCFYGYDILTSGGGTVRVQREYLLTYCRETYLSGEPIFITGSFSETSAGAAEGTMTGHIEGQLVLFDESVPDASLVGKTFIALTHIPDSFDGVQAPEQLVYTVIFLEPDGWFPGGIPTPTPQTSTLPTPTPRITPTQDSGGLFASPAHSDDHHTDDPYSSYEEDHHDTGGSSGSRSARRSSSSDMPEASGSMQVAVGAIFASIIAALSNIPTATIGSGMGAFVSTVGSGTGSPGPASAQSAYGASQTSSSATSTTGSGVSSADISGVPKPSGGISDILSAIGDFFKQLIANLRDMLTDEGRSYASGKITDIFEDDE